MVGSGSLKGKARAKVTESPPPLPSVLGLPWCSNRDHQAWTTHIRILEAELIDIHIRTKDNQIFIKALINRIEKIETNITIK